MKIIVFAWGSGKAYQKAMGEDRRLYAVEFVKVQVDQFKCNYFKEAKGVEK